MLLSGKAASKGHTLDDSTSTTKEQSHRRGEQRREPEAEKGAAAIRRPRAGASPP